jgi:hypothetical protein
MLIQVVILFFVSSVAALDISWLPAEADGPLPLSSNYRVALRKLCNFLAEHKTVPAELEAKRDIITSLCTKLESTDESFGESSWLNISPPSYLVCGALVLGGGTALLLWSRRSASFGRRIDGTSPSTYTNIREARLRKFD